MKHTLLTCIFILSLFTSLFSQELPAPDQSESILLVDATIHVGTGEVIEQGAVGFENGVLTFVGEASEVNRSEYQQVIEVAGQHIYPGFIATNNILGLVEVDAVRSTRDYSETGTLNPNVRALVAYNTDSKITPTVRSNGVLMTQVTPRGGRISGSSSVVQLDAWNWEDAVILEDGGIHVNWPSMFQKSGWWAEPGPTKKNKKYDEQRDGLVDFLIEAKAYAQTAEPEKLNLKFEAMRRVFTGNQRLYIHAHAAKELMNIIKIKRKLDLEHVVVVGGNDALLVAESLKENSIPVILDRSQGLPNRVDDDYDAIFTLAQNLMEKGVLVAMSGKGGMEAMNTRNLPFYAGNCVTYGMNEEDALKLITLNAAQIIGIEESHGSLETGKSATLFVSEGDALDILGNQLTYAFIDGRLISLDNHQNRLSKRFNEKYERK